MSQTDTLKARGSGQLGVTRVTEVPDMGQHRRCPCPDFGRIDRACILKQKIPVMSKSCRYIDSRLHE
jgi:hypothetical protein